MNDSACKNYKKESDSWVRFIFLPSGSLSLICCRFDELVDLIGVGSGSSTMYFSSALFPFLWDLGLGWMQHDCLFPILTVWENLFDRSHQNQQPGSWAGQLWPRISEQIPIKFGYQRVYRILPITNFVSTSFLLQLHLLVDNYRKFKNKTWLLGAGRQYGCSQFCNELSDWLKNRNYVTKILGTSGIFRAKTQIQNGVDLKGGSRDQHKRDQLNELCILNGYKK